MKIRERIIHTSIELFAVHGYEGTTLSSIAKEVGIKKPSLYAHFDSKEHIFLTAINESTKSYFQGIKKALVKIEETSAEKKLKEFLIKHLEFTLTKMGESQFYYRFVFFPPPFFEDEIQQIKEKFDNYSKENIIYIINEGKQNKEIDAKLTNEQIVKSFFSLIGGIDFDIRYYSSWNQKDLSHHLDDIWSIYWRGIKST